MLLLAMTACVSAGRRWCNHWSDPVMYNQDIASLLEAFVGRSNAHVEIQDGESSTTSMSNLEAAPSSKDEDHRERATVSDRDRAALDETSKSACAKLAASQP